MNTRSKRLRSIPHGHPGVVLGLLFAAKNPRLTINLERQNQAFRALTYNITIVSKLVRSLQAHGPGGRGFSA